MAQADATPITFRDALFLGFNTFWAARTPISYPNLPFDPEDFFADPKPDDAWVALSLLGAPEGEQHVGNAAYVRKGLFNVQIYVRGDVATDGFYVLADGALEFFELRSVDLKDGFMDQNGRLLEIGEDGVWYSGNCSVDWTYITNRAA